MFQKQFLSVFWAALFFLFSLSVAEAMDCDLDNDLSGNFPGSNDVAYLAEMVVGSRDTAPCNANACDFDGNGVSPALGDVARLVAAMRTWPTQPPDSLCVTATSQPVCASTNDCLLLTQFPPYVGTKAECKNPNQATSYCSFTNTAPTASITSPSATIPSPTYFVGQTISLKGSATDNEEWTLDENQLAWFLNDQQVGTGPTLSLTLSTTGSFTYVLKATDTPGLSDTASITIIVAPPVVYPNVAGNYTEKQTLRTTTNTICGTPGTSFTEPVRVTQNGKDITLVEDPDKDPLTYLGTLKTDGAFTALAVLQTTAGPCTLSAAAAFDGKFTSTGGTATYTAVIRVTPPEICPDEEYNCNYISDVVLTKQSGRHAKNKNATPDGPTGMKDLVAKLAAKLAPEESPAEEK